MTCSDKRDHSGFFVNIVFLVRIVSAMNVEYNGEDSMKKILLMARVISVFVYPGSLLL